MVFLLQRTHNWSYQHPPSPPPSPTRTTPPARQKAKLRVQQLVKKLIAISHGVKEGATPLHEFYHLEALDTQHRYGNDTYPYFEIWKNTATRCNFLEWLSKIEKGERVDGDDKLREKQLITAEGKPTKAIRRVTYLKHSDLPPYKLYLDHNGDLYTGMAGKLDSQIFSKENPYIFVVARNGEIYVESYERGRIHHSSFCAGGAVISAGTAFFKDGKLIEITDKTGHYTVSKELIQKGLEALAKKGVDLTNVKVSINAYTGCTKPREEYSALTLLQEWREKNSSPISI